MNHTATISIPPVNATRMDALRWLDWMAGIVRSVETWRLRHQSRRQFEALGAQSMRDAGIDPAFRFVEVNKPFWEE